MIHIDIIRPGLYRHFKNQVLYRVIGEVWDSEFGGPKILYQNEAGDYFSRSLESWIEPAQDSAGNLVERFRYVSN